MSEEKVGSDGRDIVLTVATNDEGYFPYFVQSCNRYNIKPVIIGRGVEWRGFGTKFRLIKDWVTANANDNDRILIVDCYDLIFLRELEPLFQSFSAKAKASPAGAHNYMYAANEPLSWPSVMISGSYYGVYKNKIVNSGSFLTHASLLKRMFTDKKIDEALYQNKISDDQALLTQFLNDNDDVDCHLDDNMRFIVYPGLRVDVGARLDLSDPNQVTYRRDSTFSRPYLVHRCGHGKMTALLRQLGYVVDKEPDSSFVERVIKCHIPGMVDKFIITPFNNTVGYVQNAIA